MQRNITLDYFKLILAILVVFIHMPFLFEKDSTVSWYLSKGFADIAVPCFFVINGYFLISKIDDKKKFGVYIFHILIVYLVWSIIYLPNYCFVVPMKYTMLMFLSGYYQLWYLTALLAGACLLFIARTITKNNNLILVIAAILYLIIRVINKGDFPIIGGYLFNIFTGFLFVTMGYYVRSKIDISKIKSAFLGVALLASFVIYLLGVHPEFSHPLKAFAVAGSLATTCVLLVMTIFKHSVYRDSNRYNTLLGNLSAGIFYVHVLVTTRIVPIQVENNIILLPSVLAISFFMALVVIWFNKRAKYLM